MSTLIPPANRDPETDDSTAATGDVPVSVAVASPRLSGRGWIALAFGLPFLLFLTTTCRTLYVGDAGDFAVACWTYGIPHPPGYPLYTLLGSIFARLPIPGGETEVAWRLNLMSAVFGALTCGLVYLLLERVSKVRSLALIAACAVAVSRAFWWQASITEVYTLNTFFMALHWWLALRYIETDERKWWQWLLFTMSLSLAHHQSIVLFFPFVFGWIWWERRSFFPGSRQGAATATVPLSTAAEWTAALLLLLVPMLTLYLYLPLVDCKTPVTENRVLFTTPAEEFRYVVYETILRNVYTNKAKFENPTTSAQVASYYLKYLIGDPTQAHDPFESGDQGTLTLGLVLALWAAFFWKPTIPEDLPEAMRPPVDLPRVRRLGLLFLSAMAFFMGVVIFAPTGDILGAAQTNLRVVMPPLLVPGHYFLVLAIFIGAMAVWYDLPSYVWRMREQDPMPVESKLALSRRMLLIALAGLVIVNGYNNWPVGNKSQSYISWSYVQNVVRSTDPDTFVLNTGDETFLYWYLDKVHWVLHPAERPKDVVFTNWIHQIPNYEELAGKTEAELQRDIIGYFMKQQLVERAARRLGAESTLHHQLHLGTTFFRPEFLRVPFFRYWHVQMDGLLYKWEPIEDYEPIAIQNLIQTNETEATWDRLDPSAIAVLSQYLTVLLYERSPAFAAQVNTDAGQPAEDGGAASLAPLTEIGPLTEQDDGTLRGPIPSMPGMSDADLLSLSDANGNVIYQMEAAPNIEIELIDRDWWTFYDWRGVLSVHHDESGVRVEPAQVPFDAQEEEILARFQDLFVQNGLQHYSQATELDTQVQAMAKIQHKTPDEIAAFEAVRDQQLKALLEADRWLGHAVKLPFIYHPDLAATSWGLMGDIKLNLGQTANAAAAYNYLVLKLPPDEFPIEAARARANLAIVESARGKRAEAERLVTEALLIDPNNTLATQLKASWQAISGASTVPMTSPFAIQNTDPAAPEAEVPADPVP